MSAPVSETSLGHSSLCSAHLSVICLSFEITPVPTPFLLGNLHSDSPDQVVEAVNSDMFPVLTFAVSSELISTEQ